MGELVFTQVILPKIRVAINPDAPLMS
jgi:hypothetical protein